MTWTVFAVALTVAAQVEVVLDLVDRYGPHVGIGLVVILGQALVIKMLYGRYERGLDREREALVTSHADQIAALMVAHAREISEMRSQVMHWQAQAERLAERYDEASRQREH